MAFCVWLLSLSILFSRFICVAPWIRTSLLQQLNNIPLYGDSTFVYPLIRWWAFGLFPETVLFETLVRSSALFPAHYLPASESRASKTARPVCPPPAHGPPRGFLDVQAHSGLRATTPAAPSACNALPPNSHTAHLPLHRGLSSNVILLERLPLTPSPPKHSLRPLTLLYFFSMALITT